MKISNNTILITGGATGIGLKLAEQFISKGNTVIVCGRRDEKLEQAKKINPNLVIRKCDLSIQQERKELFEFCTQNYPAINMLINNAGMQREINFLKGEQQYLQGDNEVSINLEACFHLSALFVPYFLNSNKSENAIVNVSSGLGIVPMAIAPVYSATKAGIHSFTQSLRMQLSKTNIKVFEIIPPIVDTDLDRGARNNRKQKDKGIKPEQVAMDSIQAIEKDHFEIPIGLVKVMKIGSRIAPSIFFNIINKSN